MDAMTRTTKTLDLPLGPGRQTLRLILHLNEQGAPEARDASTGRAMELELPY